jgi:hypothetical protein
MPKMDETTATGGGGVQEGGCEWASYFRMPNQKQGPTSTVSSFLPSLSNNLFCF